MDNYLWRMSNIIGINLETNESKIEKLRYPSRKDLEFEIEVSSINLLEFLRLSKCELQRTIGERNSALGKLQPASQRLAYNQLFIQQTKDCLKILDANNSLYNPLSKAIEKKKLNSVKLFWNATFSSEEFQKFFSGNTIISAKEGLAQSSIALQSIEIFMQAFNSLNKERLDIKNFEQALGSIHSNKLMGNLLLSVTSSIEKLNLLTDYLETNPACNKLTSTRHREAFKNVFTKYYLGEVQPMLADFFRAGDSIIFSIEHLLNKFTELSPKTLESYWFEQWSTENKRSRWNALRELTRDHALALKTALEDCGFQPGKNL